MPTTSSFDLAKVAISAADGDGDALEVLLRELHPLLRRFFTRRFKNEPDLSDVVDDLAQQTLFRIARGITDCTAHDEPGVLAWTLAIARNCAMDYLRGVREERSLRCFFSDLEAAASWSSVQDWDMQDAEASPGLQVLQGLIQQAQDSLPERTQRLLWLRLVEHAPWADVAAEFGTEYRAAQRRYQRAQKALRTGVLCLSADLPARERELVLTHLGGFGVHIDDAAQGGEVT